MKFSSTLKISDKYSDRVEFIKQNYSLILKNLQQADNGIYDAVIQGDTDEIVIRYVINVEGRLLFY